MTCRPSAPSSTRSSIQRGRAPAGVRARGPERLRALARADDRADGHPLRLADRPARPASGPLGACRLCRGAAMTVRDQLSPRNPWFAASVGIVAALVVLTALGGFLLLPYAQPDLRFRGVWDAICSAAGVVREPSSAVPVQPGFQTSTV